MTRIAPLNPADLTDARRPALDRIAAHMGGLPNMFRTVAHSSAALDSMWASFAALGRGRLGAALGEQIAVAVADRNGCEYCLAVHTVLGGQAGVAADALRDAQGGESADPKTAAALRFALKLVDGRGHVEDADVQAVRDAGFDDGQIVEILAHVALNLFTNYVNVAFEVPLDFPAVPLRSARR